MSNLAEILSQKRVGRIVYRRVGEIDELSSELNSSLGVDGKLLLEAEISGAKTRPGPLQLARGPREPVPDASLADIVSGKPPRNCRVPLTCQLPATALMTRFHWLPNFLPRPTGSS